MDVIISRGIFALLPCFILSVILGCALDNPLLTGKDASAAAYILLTLLYWYSQFGSAYASILQWQSPKKILPCR